MQRLFVAALAAVVLLPVSGARADWWSDARLVKQGIAQAVHEGWITPDEAQEYRVVLTLATETWRRLPGTRSTNLAGVLHDVARQYRSYIAPRALALFSMLETNARYLGSNAMPAGGADVRGTDGIVYRAFAGHGLQFHPLANFARLNSLLAADNGPAAAELAAALISRAVPRSGAWTWEYYFPFGGGTPPWTSGMVQAVAARAFAADGDYDEARKAFLALSRLTFPLAGGVWVRLYSFSNLAVLNAQLQAALSLADYGLTNQDPGATELAESLLETADALFPSFDTGAWSLYALAGAEAKLNYHVYVVNLLKRIARSTQDPEWLERAELFDRYTEEPPIVTARGPSRPVRWTARIELWLSKVSRVTLKIGATSTSATFSRGSHTLYWTAAGRRPGRYAVRVTAVDLAGNRTVRTLAPVRVRRTAPLP